MSVARRFPRSHRLTQSNHYRDIFNGSKRRGFPGFLLLFKKNGLSHARLGLIVGKRAVKKACKRNEIKRVIRESFRYHQDFPVGYDVIVLAKPGAADCSKQALRRQLDHQWNRRTLKTGERTLQERRQTKRVNRS